MKHLIRSLIMVIIASIALYLILYLNGCSHEEKETDETATFEQAQAKRMILNMQISEIQDSYGFVGTRCDGTTFTALLMAFSAIQTNINLYAAESEPGKWERHPDPCYPDASQSETSLDVYLMVLHWLLSMPDRNAARDELAKIIEYGESNGWIMGQGSVSLTNILALVPLIYKMRDLFEGNAIKELTGESDDSVPILSGHKGHIAAFYSFLSGRITGQIGTANLSILGALAGEFPRNPIYQAIYHRYLDGDQGAMADIVVNDYSDKIDKNVGCLTWGSAPCVLFPIVSVAIAEGK